MKNEKDEVLGFLDELREHDPEYAKYSKVWGALASFLNDYELLKGLNKLTQADIAKKCATTQSAISRLERMKGKPTYELLRRLSTAVGGELFITPLGDVTITLPYDLHEKARDLAKEQEVSTHELLANILREGIESIEYTSSDQFETFNASIMSRIIKSFTYENPSKWSVTSIEADKNADMELDIAS